MGALCIFLLIACYYDYRFQRIPNILILFMLITGMIWRFYVQGGRGVLFFFVTMLGVIICLSPFFRIKALGAGDVKMFGVCSGYCLGEEFLYFLFFALLLAAGVSILKMIINRNKEYLKMKIPLAGPVLLSILLHIGGVY